MRKKDDLAIDKIMECAKTEFLEKGFEGASMRKVAENAGYTTGMLYGRFADKGELFKAIVKASAEKLYSYYFVLCGSAGKLCGFIARNAI